MAGSSPAMTERQSTYGVSTGRTTNLPLCRSFSASLAFASGIVVTGIGAIFLVRSRSSNSWVSLRLPTWLPWIVIALIGISGNAQVAPPPNRPTMTSLPPLARQSKPSCVVAALPTRSITARMGPPAFLASCSSASGDLPSAGPRMGQGNVPGFDPASIGFLDIRPERQNLADRLVPHRARQRHAAILQRQRLAAMAEIVAAFPDMQVAMADAGGLDLDQHLRAGGLRRRLIHLFQGGIELGDLETLHRFSPGILVLEDIVMGGPCHVCPHETNAARAISRAPPRVACRKRPLFHPPTDRSP